MTNEKAIKEVQRWLDGCPFEDTKEAFDLAIKALERPQGKWILCEDNNFSRCSICGVIRLNEECNNYCPKCGSYMRSNDDGKK